MTRHLQIVALLLLAVCGRAAAADPVLEVRAGTEVEHPPDDPDGAPMPVDGNEWDYQPIDDGAITHRTVGREAFRIDVAPDGGAQIRDARNLRFVIGNPAPTRANERQLAVPREQPPPPPPRDQEGERPVANPVGDIGVAIARFDLGDWAMRLHGDDPYAARKLAALDATRERRAMIGDAYRAHQLASSGRIMQGNLERLWTRVADPAQRRRELFALWDECAEVGTDAVVKGGTEARERVLKLIAQMMPAGSPAAFSAAELAQLNARRTSRAEFSPYAAPAAPAASAPPAEPAP